MTRSKIFILAVIVTALLGCSKKNSDGDSQPLGSPDSQVFIKDKTDKLIGLYAGKTFKSQLGSLRIMATGEYHLNLQMKLRYFPPTEEGGTRTDEKQIACDIDLSGKITYGDFGYRDSGGSVWISEIAHFELSAVQLRESHGYISWEKRTTPSTESYSLCEAYTMSLQQKGRLESSIHSKRSDRFILPIINALQVPAEKPKNGHNYLFSIAHWGDSLELFSIADQKIDVTEEKLSVLDGAYSSSSFNNAATPDYKSAKLSFSKPFRQIKLDSSMCGIKYFANIREIFVLNGQTKLQGELTNAVEQPTSPPATYCIGAQKLMKDDLANGEVSLSKYVSIDDNVRRRVLQISSPSLAESGFSTSGWYFTSDRILGTTEIE